MKIIADSSLDISKEIKDLDINFVPFKLNLGEKQFVDDENLDVINFINEMGEYSGVAKSACPSPNDFLKYLEKGQENYIVTISSQLSGTYNAAKLAEKLFLEENPDETVYVFDSKSASIGETLTALKIKELEKDNISSDELIDKVENYISEMHTFFISESLDNLMKNGRIPRFKGTIAKILNVKPVMGTNDAGDIILFQKERGVKKAYSAMVELIKKHVKNSSKRVLAISHVNNLKRAEMLKKMIEEQCDFKEIIIVQTAGLSSLYCDNKGVIVSF